MSKLFNILLYKYIKVSLMVFFMASYAVFSAIPAHALSVFTNPRNHQNGFKNGVELRKNMPLHEQALRSNYRYISVRIGGTNCTVALLNGHNAIVKMQSFKWEEMFHEWQKKREDKSLENARDVIEIVADKIAIILSQSNEPRINHISLNTAAPIDKDFGLVGTDFPAPSLPFNNFPILKELKTSLDMQGISPDVITLHNDTEVAVMGETLIPRGHLYSHDNGCAMIIGTGINMGVKKNGEFYMGEQEELREMGHNIMQERSADGTIHYKWVGREAKTFHPIEEGREDEIVMRKSREMGVKYVADPKRFKKYFPDFPILASGLRDLEGAVSGKNIRKRLLREGRFESVEELTRKALSQNINGSKDENIREQVLARNEIRKIAHEIGKGLAAFIDAYKDERFVEHIVLCSGVAENLGKGVYDNVGDSEDIFIKTIRRSVVDELNEHFKSFPSSKNRAYEIAAGIVRSEMDYERELVCHKSTIEEMELFERQNENYAYHDEVHETELEHVEDMIKRIDMEMKHQGSGNLPKKIIMSDFHGAADTFFAYIIDAIYRDTGEKITLDYRRFIQGVSIREQLKEQRINDLKELINFEFYLLGDFADRGKYGLTCFLAAIELHKLGVAKIVLGNHDLWLLGSVMGKGFPLDRGYNMYGHTKSIALLEEHKNEFSSYHERFKAWAERYRIYRREQDKMQNRKEQDKMQSATMEVDGREITMENALKELRDIYEALDVEALEPEEKKLLHDLIGKNIAGVDIWTGFRAFGHMSDEWWRERLDKAVFFREQYPDPLHPMNTVWDTMHTYIKAALPVFEKQLAKMNKEYWWWQVFNDINHMNYSSPEWAALDWLYHYGWGENILKELNEMEKNKSVVWNEVNFMDHPLIQRVISFSMENPRLSLEDEYRNLYLHGWVPFDEDTGRIDIEYDGVHYADSDIWEMFAVLSDSIRSAQSTADMQEAWDLIMSWYADNTIKIKPGHIRYAINKFGLEGVLAPLHRRILFMGHNPQNKMMKEAIGFMVYQDDYATFLTDKGMETNKYKDLGCYVEVSANGVKAYGYNTTAKKKIVENPATVTLGKDKEIVSGMPNAYLGRRDFLRIAKKQLVETRDRLRAEEERAVLMAA